MSHFLKDFMQSEASSLTTEATTEIFSAMNLLQGMPGIAKRIKELSAFVRDRASTVSANDLVALVSKMEDRVDISRVQACLKNLKKEDIQKMKSVQDHLDGFLCICIRQLLAKALVFRFECNV